MARLGQGLGLVRGPMRGTLAAIAVGTFLPTVATAPNFVGGTRKGVSTYSGPAIRIQKSAGDATQSDISFLSSGLIDTAAVMAFMGAASIDGALVTTVYDQTGSGNHATQTTAAMMPPLATDPEGQPIVSWSVSASYLTLPIGLALNSTATSFFHLGRMVAGALFQFGTGVAVQAVSTSGKKLCYGTSVSRTSAFAPYENTSVIGMVSGASLIWSLDSTLSTASTAATSAATTGGRLGNSTGANTFMAGDSQLWAFYPAALSVGDAASVRTAMMAMRSIAVKNKVLVLSEDSYTAGTGSTFQRNRSYYALTDAAIRNNVRVYNKGKGGRQLDVAATDFPSEGPMIFDATATANVWAILGGANDSSGGASAATVESRFQTYANTVTAAGFTAVSYGIPVGSAGASVHDAFNAWMAANYATFSSSYIDLDAAGYNTRVDGVHPDSAGYAAWSAWERPTLKARLGL